jgi:hypothetical protein
MDWEQCENYVAKRYLVPGTPRETYFSDIEMQMISKRYARQYTALGPPKKVDFLQAFVIEVVRNGAPMLYCVERALEFGSYTKHNNNSGFVEVGDDDPASPHHKDVYRATPNAFSRFTFHHSSGQLQIVDIQGVDDVYTDPQIHTSSGSLEYGEGNLGVSGMALFFSTSAYDALCRKLKLPNFAISPAEKARIDQHHGLEERLSNRGLSAQETISRAEIILKERRGELERGGGDQSEVSASGLPFHLLAEGAEGAVTRREAGLPEDAHTAPPAANPPPTPSVGLVHARMAELNLSGALPLLEEKPDVPSALFHVVCAASANEPRALRDLRSLCRGLAADELLPGVRLMDSEVSACAAHVPTLTVRLAASGDATAMLETANADAALGGDEALRRAARWVQAAIDAVGRASEKDQAELRLGGCALFQLLQRLAELQADLGDTTAAAASYEAASEAAMEEGKTKAAMKLSALAEQYAGEGE